MSKMYALNIFTHKYIFQELQLSINSKILTAMVGYTAFKESSTKIVERDEALIISCRAGLLCYCSLVTKKEKTI